MKYLRAILTLCALCASCNNTSYDSTTKNKQVSGRLSNQELKEIRRYAEHFQFEESVGYWFVAVPKKPDPATQTAIKHATKTNEERHFPYATLFVLRLHHEHKKRYNKSYRLDFLKKTYPGQYEGQYDLADEFIRLAKLENSKREYQTQVCYNWIKENKSLFLNYKPLIEELGKIDQLKKDSEYRWQQIMSETASDIKKLEYFAIECPIIENGRAPEPVPAQINRILKEFREQGRTDHLPYLFEYGLNLYWRNLIHSRLARILPVNENLMLSELVHLAKIPKYRTAHEAGWLNNQFYGSFRDINEATGYSSYQIYIWYLENWSSVSDMPNIERLCDIQKQIEKTGMHGVGGGQVCHYGCR